MTKEIDLNVQKPDDRITIMVNGVGRELFMSAGMIRKIAMIAGEYEDFSVVYLDALAQERCMIELLVERDERGKPKEDTKDLTLMAFEMSTHDADSLAKWIGDHIVNFFISGAMSMKNSVEAQQKVFQTLTQSLTGMSNSIQMKPSAGPSK